MSFSGKGTGFDPFDFLDGAPIITRPLDLGDTDSNEEASETASSVSLGSVSTTASTHPTQASTLTASPQAPRPILKPRPAMPDKVSSIEYAKGCIPTSLSDIHHTGIPPGVSCKRWQKTTARGASLYICPHRDCGATPYVGDLYNCSSHLRRVHFGTCLICPYCPNQRYYRASGWKTHMSSKHSSVPWFGAPEATQASLMLATIQLPLVQLRNLLEWRRRFPWFDFPSPKRSPQFCCALPRKRIPLRSLYPSPQTQPKKILPPGEAGSTCYI